VEWLLTIPWNGCSASVECAAGRARKGQRAGKRSKKWPRIGTTSDNGSMLDRL
jgi:hypothetical protein